MTSIGPTTGPYKPKKGRPLFSPFDIRFGSQQSCKSGCREIHKVCFPDQQLRAQETSILPSHFSQASYNCARLLSCSLTALCFPHKLTIWLPHILHHVNSAARIDGGETHKLKRYYSVLTVEWTLGLTLNSARPAANLGQYPCLRKIQIAVS